MTKRKRAKKPKHNEGSRIKTHSSKDVSDEDRIPKFSLRFLQSTRCISHCTTKEKASLIDTLHKLSQVPWKEIRKSSRHGIGCEKIDHSSIRVPIPNEMENENILAMRFYGKAPMIGFKKQATFYIVWIDRRYNTYNH